MIKTVFYVFLCFAILAQGQSGEFYDCEGELSSMVSDAEALDKIKQLEQQKFSSKCLEVILKKNFFETGDYLMKNYYSKTSIDTEVIVKSVISDVARNQQNLIFQIKKGQATTDFPIVSPVIYWAQSIEDVFVKVKISSDIENTMCNQTFDRQVQIKAQGIRIQAFCMENPDNIIHYDTGFLEFKRKVIPHQVKYEWKHDGQVTLTMKKEDGPSYWKKLLSDTERQKSLYPWREILSRHIDQLEEYIQDENHKEKSNDL